MSGGDDRRRRRNRNAGSSTTSGTTPAFTGFSAFAAQNNSGGGNATVAASDRFRPSPVFVPTAPSSAWTDRASLAFKRVSQKRDAATKTKALEELAAVLRESADARRPDVVAAACHHAHVFTTRSAIDNDRAVRRRATEATTEIARAVPKAHRALALRAADDNHESLFGVLWCLRSDGAAEVERAARECCEASTIETSDHAERVLRHVLRTLRHERPSSLAAGRGGLGKSSASSSSSSNSRGTGSRDKKDGRGNAAAAAAAAAALSDVEREEAEERFDRVMRSALGGFAELLRVADNDDDVCVLSLLAAAPDRTALWTHLGSSRPALRRATARLVTLLASRVEHDVLPTEDRFLQTLRKERDPIVMPALLEAALATLSHQRYDATAVVEAVRKHVRKACHGASPATSWTPSILPLSSFCGNDERAVALMEDLWDGRTSAANGSDEAAIVSAASECATYLLCRKRRDDGSNDVDVSATAARASRCFVRTLSYSLESTHVSTSVRTNDGFVASLGKNLMSLDRILNAGENDNGENTNRLLTSVADSLRDDVREAVAEAWNRDAAVAATRFALLLEAINDGVFLLLPAARASVTAALGSAAPGAARLVARAARSYGARAVLDDVERYCTNDLLTRIVTTTKTNDAWYDVLRECLVSITAPSRRASVWETVLREIVAADRGPGTVATCLRALTTTDDKDEEERSLISTVRCRTLEDYAVRVATESGNLIEEEEDEEEDDDYEDDDSEVRSFLRTCLGLVDNDGGSPLLIGTRVVRDWIGIAASSGGRILTDVLVDAFLAPEVSVVGEEDAVGLLSAAWSRDASSSSWRRRGLPASVRRKCSEECVARARRELSEEEPSYEDEDDVRQWSRAWTRRIRDAIDFFEIEEEGDDENLLARLGLDAPASWTSSAHLWCLCETLLSSPRSVAALTVDLVSNALLFAATRTSMGPDDALWVVTERIPAVKRAIALTEAAWGTGGEEVIDDALVESCCAKLVEILVESWREGNAIRSACVTDALVSLLRGSLGEVTLRGDDDDGKTASHDHKFEPVVATEVRKGDALWYEERTEDGGNSDGDKRMVSATVLKVHTDDLPHLYFTIGLKSGDGDTKATERQTVANRLRTRTRSKVRPTFREIVPRTSSKERERASRLERLLVDKVVNVGLSHGHRDHVISLESASRCVDLLISRCGLVDVGLGTPRYDVFRAVTALSQRLETSLALSSSVDDAISILRYLTLAMVGSAFPSSSPSPNFDVLRFDPTSSLRTICEAYEREERVIVPGNRPALDQAVLYWTCVASAAIKDATLLRRIVELWNVLVPKQDDVLTEAFASSAVNHILSEWDDDGGADPPPSPLPCVRHLVFRFATAWPDSDDDDDRLPLWRAPFAALTLNDGARAIVREAAAECANELCGALFLPTKRELGVRSLGQFASGLETAPFADDETPLPDRTRALLETAASAPEEIDEIEEDVFAARDWVPGRVMEELEGWTTDNEIDDDDDDDVLFAGRAATWTTFLDFLEAAADVDSRHRASVGTYARVTGATNVVLDAALRRARLDDDRPRRERDVPDSSSDDSSRTAVAEDVLVRTFRSLPTLSRAWFDDRCPRSRRAAVDRFVAARVAPDTFRAELGRVAAAATELGDVVVKGSGVSREMVATYVQDECRLSVTVRVPDNFPLRNVEVDCRRTRGVPERRWRRWSLQIMRMLNGRDGTVLDALLLWKRNVDKEFEGVEPCPVCYSVLCVKTHSMPDLECKTCKHRFHKSCLYKWFQSSGKSQCVLCQQPWSGTKVA